MNIVNVVNHAHDILLESLDNLPEKYWTNSSVTGSWNLKDIIGHLAVYEIVASEVLKKNFSSDAITPLLDKRRDIDYQFNNEQAALRKDTPYQEILQEYLNAHDKLIELIKKIPDEKLHEPGTLRWYNFDYPLDEYLVYKNYGHKRHHAAQIKLFLQNEDRPR